MKEEFKDPNPDCVNCSYLGAAKYKLCDACFAVAVRERVERMPGGLVKTVLMLATEESDGGPDIVPQPFGTPRRVKR